MKEIVDYLNTKSLICKSLKEITPKSLGSRKKIKIYAGVNLKGYYCSIFIIKKSSRILRKEVAGLIELHKKLEVFMDTSIHKRYISIDAPLCSHAKAMLQEAGWKVWHEHS